MALVGFEPTTLGL